MAYPNRTPEEQAAIDQRKYRAWNELKSGVGHAVGPAAQEFGAGLRAGAQALVPAWDFRSPGAAYTPERTQQIVQDFRGSLPGPAAGKPAFADRRPTAATPMAPRPTAMGARDPVLNQFPLTTGLGLPGLMPSGTPAVAAGPRRETNPVTAALRDAPTDATPVTAPPVGTPPRRTAVGSVSTGRVRNSGLPPGQGWVQTDDGTRYEINGDQVQKFGPDGYPQGFRGVVNVLGPEESRNLFGGSRGAGIPVGLGASGGSGQYDPNQLAAAQFERIKGAADQMMLDAERMFDSNPMKSAKIKAAQSLYAQLGGANNAGVAAGGGIAQEGIRGGSAQDVQRLLNEGQVNEQQVKNQGALGLQALTGGQAIDLEQLKNEGALSKERLITDREYARLAAERQDKAAEMMGLTTYDPTTGFPAGQVPSRKYQYGEQQKQQQASGPQAGMIYPGKDGKKYRYNGGDPNDSKSYTVMP